MPENKLNNKQRLFCMEYLIDFNATQAALRVGYSKKTARFIGAENLTKPNIQAEISTQISEILKKAKIPLEKQIFDFWIKRAFYDITEIIGINGQLKIDQEQLREKGLHVCIDSINKKVNAQGMEIITYEFADKDKAVEMLQKYIQMIKEKVEITGGLQLFSDEVVAKLNMIFSEKEESKINEQKPKTKRKDD
jgi:phage terminase small subunit